MPTGKRDKQGSDKNRAGEKSQGGASRKSEENKMNRQGQGQQKNAPGQDTSQRGGD